MQTNGFYLIITELIICFEYTGYVDKTNGEVVMDSRKIAQRYVMRRWPCFLLDIVCSIPIDYIYMVLTAKHVSPSAMVQVVKSLKLIRAGRITRLIRYIRRWQAVSLTWFSSCLLFLCGFALDNLLLKSQSMTLNYIHFDWMNVSF